MGNTEFVLIILLLLITAGGVLFLALRQNRMELILRDLEAEDIQDELVRIGGQRQYPRRAEGAVRPAERGFPGSERRAEKVCESADGCDAVSGKDPV